MNTEIYRMLERGTGVASLWGLGGVLRQACLTRYCGITIPSILPLHPSLFKRNLTVNSTFFSEARFAKSS